MTELYMVIIETTDEELLVFDHNVDHDGAVQSSRRAEELMQPRKVWIVPQARQYNLT